MSRWRLTIPIRKLQATGKNLVRCPERGAVKQGVAEATAECRRLRRAILHPGLAALWGMSPYVLVRGAWPARRGWRSEGQPLELALCDYGSTKNSTQTKILSDIDTWTRDLRSDTDTKSNIGTKPPGDPFRI